MDTNDTDTFLKCAFINIQSVGNKTLEIRELITDGKYDILCLAETWLNEFDMAKIAEMTPQTHSFLHVPRQGRGGGGVGLFLSKCFSEVKIVNHPLATSFERISVNFKHEGQNLSFIVVYRPPDSGVHLFFEEFDGLLESIDLLARKVVICGDFNFWLDDEANNNANSFKDMLMSNQLMNNVDRPTSSTGHMLDLIICDSIDRIIMDVEVEEKCRFTSVHKLISFCIPLLKDKVKKKISFRNKSDFNQIDYINVVSDKFDELLLTQCIHTERNRSKSDCVECLMEIYNFSNKNEYDTRCPEVEKMIVIIDKSPWFNGETLSAKREKRRKENAWLRNKTDNTWSAYCIAKNRYNNIIKQSKINYYRRKIVEAAKDAKKLYRLLNGLTGCFSEKNLPDGKSDQLLANEFLKFFKNKIDNISNSFTQNLVSPIFVDNTANIRLSSFQTIDDISVANIITSIKKTNCVLDPMPISDITSAENFLSFVNVLVRIVNTSITTCKFPTSEKMAIVRPILKSGLDPQSLSSYRPVSNLSFISKVIENVILKQLMAHLDRVDALPDNQSAYRQFYSTETTVCSVVSDLLTMMDDGKCSILILLDLSAAFDTVVHHLLIEDLRSVGVEGDALEYLADYLKDRKYCVRIGNSSSGSESLRRGVPQGSVLGPILFCIYTIGLSKMLSDLGVEFRTFADDTQFYLAVTDIEATCGTLSHVLNNIKTWMMYKQLKLNVNKTEYMIVGKRHDLNTLGELQFVVNNNQIEFVDKVRDLGVLLDSTLSFSSQISSVLRTTSYHLRNIAFIRKYLDEDSTKKLVCNCVINRLDYCNSIYYMLPNFQLKKLQKILNRAARLVKGVSRRDRITPVLIELHWLPIKARIKFKLCTLTHQAIITGKPAYLRNMITVRQPIESGRINTRLDTDGRKLMEPRCYSNVGFRSFRSAAPRLYNTLPLEIRLLDTLPAFKRKLKTFLFTDCYDLDDKFITENYVV